MCISGRICIGIPSSQAAYTRIGSVPAVLPTPVEDRLVAFLQQFPSVRHLDVALPVLQDTHPYPPVSNLWTSRWTNSHILVAAIAFVFPLLESLSVNDPHCSPYDSRPVATVRMSLANLLPLEHLWWLRLSSCQLTSPWEWHEEGQEIKWPPGLGSLELCGCDISNNFNIIKTSSLRQLKIHGCFTNTLCVECPCLEGLDIITSELYTLQVHECIRLERMYLCEIHISGLEDIPRSMKSIEFDYIGSLQSVAGENCSSLETLVCRNCVGLRSIVLRGHPCLEKVDAIGMCDQLQMISLQGLGATVRCSSAHPDYVLSDNS